MLMRIPSKCLMTLKRVEQSSIGPSLFKVVNEVNDSELFNKKDDLVLALFLAFVLDTIKRDDVTCEEFVDVQIYLSTLPENNSYNNLPRRWPDDVIQDLLGGTSVFRHVEEEKEGLKKDYSILKESYGNISSSLDFHRFPLFESFDHMLAAVGSRAFDSLGQDGMDAMVPILDLLDHKRGVNEKSDVSYTRSEEDGSILIVSKHDLCNGISPGNTYGAKGNAQLLTRYGFTLEDNIEPDGSSNDVLELPIQQSICNLRTGPKSYTYGCFVKVLELLRDEEEKDYPTTDKTDRGPDDINSFLDSCEQEDNAIHDFDIYCEMEDDSHDDFENDYDSDKRSDCKAIDRLKDILKQAASGLSLNGNRLHKMRTSTVDRERFCAYLITSELRTIEFYQLAADLILSKLKGKDEVAAEIYGKKDTKYELFIEQARELQSVFFQIRYPN